MHYVHVAFEVIGVISTIGMVVMVALFVSVRADLVGH